MCYYEIAYADLIKTRFETWTNPPLKSFHRACSTLLSDCVRRPHRHLPSRISACVDGAGVVRGDTRGSVAFPRRRYGVSTEIRELSCRRGSWACPLCATVLGIAEGVSVLCGVRFVLFEVRTTPRVAEDLFIHSVMRNVVITSKRGIFISMNIDDFQVHLTSHGLGMRSVPALQKFTQNNKLVDFFKSSK